MRPWLVVICILLMLPSVLLATEEPVSPYRWSIGYERDGYYYGGPVLRRFLGEHWEISISGGPDDWLRKSDSLEFTDFNYPDEDFVTMEDIDRDLHKSESGWVELGVGRRILKEGGFWLTVTTSLEYAWDNFQDQTYDEHWFRYESVVEFTDRLEVGHTTVYTINLGLRPAFDLTDRITVAMSFGFCFRSSSTTVDRHYSRNAYDEDSVWLGSTTEHERRSSTNQEFQTYGRTGINYLSFIFRF